MINDLAESFSEWCSDRSWLIRVPVALLMAHQAYHYLSDPYYSGFFSAITFGIHELGHVLFSPFGLWVSVLGGSFAQIAAPAITILLFWRQPDYFAMTVGGVWLSTAAYELAVYVEDASTMTLPLLSLSDEAYHDWNYLLTSINMLQSDQAIARFLRLCAGALMVASLAAAVWMMWMMWRTAKRESIESNLD